MPVRCQDCNSHFLLDGTTVAQGIGCPDCGGTKLERDQPSPTHSDGEVRNMVDPATQLDQGGNPLQEGVWAGVDGGWQPSYRRDETFAKIAATERYLPQSGIEPTVHGTATPSPEAGLHLGNMYWLNFLDAHINGEPVRENYDRLFAERGIPGVHKFGEPVTVSVHHPEHLPAAIEAVESPYLKNDKSTLAYTPTLAATGKAIAMGQIPAPPMEAHHLQTTSPRVMSNHYNRTLPMDPYLPWYHQADVQRFDGDGGAPITLTNEEWAADKKNRYQDRQNAQSGHRLEWQPGQRGRGIMIAGQLHTWPVNEPTETDLHGGLRHGEYIKHLGVNPQNVDFNTGFEINPDGSMVGNNIHPAITQIDPFLNHGDQQESWGDVFAKTSFLPALAPLVGMGGRMLLGAALGGLMRKAVGGAGNFLQQGQGEQPYAGAPPVSLVASEHVGVGHNAPVETPDSTPDFVEDHDPEAVDQQEFNDGDHSPAGNNPNLNGEAGGSQNPAGGEDQTVQKLEFRHDGDGVSHAEMLLPMIMEYVNSDKSALENSQLRALHEQLEKEIPGYLELADENDESVHKFLQELRKPDAVQSKVGYMGPADMPANQNPQAGFIQQALMMAQYYEAQGNYAEAQKYQQMAAQAGHGQQMAASTHQAAPVYQGTPIPQAQMQMGNQQTAMPGTFQNPIQPGGMPVSGKCMNCGGVTNDDGSCPQCGAAAGANQQGNMQAAPHPGQQTPLGIMPSPYSHTAADHQGPITPQQKEAFAQHLIEQGRNDEVAPMMTNPAMYADEWAQFINQSTQPPNVDPNEQPAPPQPQMDPSQMGQMPVPPMSVPQPTARTADVSKRCPKCQSATTSVMNDEGGMRCHRCQNVWELDGTVKEKVSSWKIKSITDPIQPNQSPANPVAAPAADATAPGDRSQDQDSSMSWQDSAGQQLEVGQTYEMHSPNYAVPDMVKVQQKKPDSIVVTMEGQYNAPSDQQGGGPEYPEEITLQQQQEQQLTFNPVQTGEGDQEQSQDQGDRDGIGQTVNTEPSRQSPEVPTHASVQKESWGGPMIQEDPQGQFHVGQQVEYQAYGGRPEIGFIVGFQPSAALDPFIKNRMGQTKVVSRQDISPEAIQIAAGFQRFAPLSEYDQYFGGESGAAAKAKAAMIKQYGEKKGEEVFYATVNKKKGSAELPTDHCPKCDYGHVTSNYNSATEIQYECFRCAHQWKIADIDEDSGLNPESRAWLEEDDGPGDFNFDRVVGIESAKSGRGRNIRDIAKRDPRHAEIHERLNKNAGAKFSPREQKEFIDEEGTARNADRLQLDGTHYVESAFDNSKARPDRVDDRYIGLGL